MKKFLLLLFLFTGVLGAIHAQEEKQFDLCKQINTLEKTGPWQVVKLTIAYMENYKKSKGGDLSEKKNKTLELLKKKYSSYKEHIKLDSIGNILNEGGWSTTKTNVFDEYRLKITNLNNIGTNITNAYKNFKPNVKDSGYRKKAIEDIDKVFDSVYKNLEDKKITPGIHTVEKKVATSKLRNEKNNRENKKNFNINLTNPFLIMIIILVLIIIYLFYLYVRSRKKIDKLKKEREINSKENGVSLIAQKEITIKNLRRTIEEKDNFIKQLENKIESLKSNEKNSFLDKKVDSHDIKILNLKQEKPISIELDPKKSTTTYYLSSPYAENLFSKEDAKDEPSSTSLYVINYDITTHKGEISIYKDANFERALNAPDMYLEKVCFTENIITNNTSKIEIFEKGEVKLEGENWVVTKKLRIKFI